MKDLKEVMDPKWIRVEGQFKPRGGISIVPVVEYTQEGYIPPQYSTKHLDHTFTTG